ncbi:MAG: hypothetical protein ACR2RL_03760 [Gammaproteobacteria bacterium]
MGLASSLLLTAIAAGGYMYWDELVESFVPSPTLIVDRSPPPRGRVPGGASAGGNRAAVTGGPAQVGPAAGDATSQPVRTGQNGGPVSGTISARGRTQAVPGSTTSTAASEPAAPVAAGPASTSQKNDLVSSPSERAAALTRAAQDREAEAEAFTRQSVAVGTLIAAGSRSRTPEPSPAPSDTSGARAARDTSAGRPASAEKFASPFPAAAPRVGVGRVAAAQSGPSLRGNGVRISRRAKPARVNPFVRRGYEAYHDGNLEAARAAYGEALRAQPRSRDALLGLAAVALREGKVREAAGGYLTLLSLNPRDEAARAGLLAIEGGVDPAGREGEVRELLRRTPDSPALHASLGSLYSQQGRWPEAQQAYFDAFRLDSANADHAYNLAVSLDQLAQRKAALNYYRRALQLSSRAGARFSRAAVTTRIDALSAQ